MYETADSIPRDVPALPAGIQQKFRELAGMVDARSLIVWGEHCSECAYPTCYTSCAFYTPRRDGDCRRFANGIERSLIGSVAVGRILFRKWAKLEGAGSTELFRQRAAARREWFDRAVSSLILNFAPQMLFGRCTRYWNRWKARRRTTQAPRIDGFVIEACVPSGPAIAMTVTVLPVEPGLDGLFQSRFDLHAGYNRVLLPYAQIAARVDLNRRFLVQIEPIGEKAVGREVIFGLTDFVRFNADARPAFGRDDTAPVTVGASPGKAARTAKCVVWDLDDTLWQGTLAEDGHEALKLDPVALSTMVELDRRGILQSVASKNDPAVAEAALRTLGIREYFLFPQIGWGPKSTSVRRIAELLDIGLDTFVFVDDQPFERGEVSERLPEVTVLPSTDIPTLLSSPLFDVPATPESAKRRAMYQTEEFRHAAFAGSETDYLTFLRDCGIRLEISDLSGAHEERAYELSQRTNQLNVSGTKYTREEIRALMDPASRQRGFILRCEDRFGDYGIIGMCVIDRDAAQVRSFMMSCRVQRKRVEQAFFGWLSKELAASRPAASLTVSYRKTPRNGAVVKMLGDLGFEYRPHDGDSGTFVRPVDRPLADDDVVTVADLTAARSRALSD